MPRLIDLLRTRSVHGAASYPMSTENHAEFLGWVREDIETSPVIVIDNVAEWCRADPRVKWDVKDIPNGAPPWQLAWFEYGGIASPGSEPGLLDG